MAVPTFKVDDCFANHPKTVELLDHPRGAEAIALWTLAGSYCARYLLDGYITDSQVRRLGLDIELADLLVDVGLWIRGDARGLSPGDSPGDSLGEYPKGTSDNCPRGYTFKDWNRWNEPKSEVESRREKERQKKRRQRQSHQKSERSPEVSPGDSPSMSPEGHHGGHLDRIGSVRDLEKLGSREQPKQRPVVRAIDDDLEGLKCKIFGLVAPKYEAKRQVPYNYGRDEQAAIDLARHVKRVEPNDPIAAVEKAFDRFIESNDAYVVKSDYSLRLFANQFNRWHSPPNSEDDEVARAASQALARARRGSR